MAKKKFDAEKITNAIYELEQNTRDATITEIRDELREWLKEPAKYGVNAENEPGIKDVIGFLTANYGLSA